MSAPPPADIGPDGTFSVTGLFGGTPATLTWHDGTLTGDPDAVAYVQAMAQLYEGRPLGELFSEPTTTNHLSSATSAYALLTRCAAGHSTLTGLVPGLLIDDVPGDADPNATLDDSWDEPEAPTEAEGDAS